MNTFSGNVRLVDVSAIRFIIDSHTQCIAKTVHVFPWRFRVFLKIPQHSPQIDPVREYSAKCHCYLATCAVTQISSGIHIE